MALFEFEDGRLIPAQFGRPMTDGLSAEVVDAICAQVLEIVSRPLFPITWRDLSRAALDPAESARLTCLDATGQVVSVEVVAHLDSDTLIASLSRLADTAALSWTDLAREYEGGVDSFRAGWLAFRDSMPPAPGAGPRLVMVVGSIDSQVRPALDVLASSGVEVHEANLRRMSNGRIFLDVQAVGPRLYGHAPQYLLNQNDQIPEIAATVADVSTADISAPASAPAPVISTTEGAPAAGEAETQRPAANEDDAALSRDANGLKVLAQLIGEEVRLVAHPDCRAPLGLVLSRDGRIRSDSGVWESPNELEEIAPALADAWDHLHIETLGGPSLAESLDEVNAEIRRERAQVGNRRATGRHSRA